MAKLRVLQLTTGLGVGGAERVVLELVGRLDGAAFECAIASIKDDVAALDVYGKPECPICVVDLRKGGLRAWRTLLAFVREFKPDIIHAHMFHSYVAALVLKVLGASGRLVLTSHGTTLPPARAAVIGATRRWRSADVIFVAGQHPSLNAANTVVIHNGVEVSGQPIRALPAADAVRFISVGRVADQKDPLGMISAFALAQIPGATLTLVGDGPLMAAAQERAQELGVSDRVIFLGTRSDVRALLKEADIFLMHSKYEGLPIALLEAGGEAMPIISTPIGAVPDLLSGNRGYLVDKSGYSDALKEVVRDLPSALVRGRRLFEVVRERYSLTAFVTHHEALYTTVHKERGV